MVKLKKSKYLSVTPKEVTFVKNENTKTFTLKNNLALPLIYKIKCSRPESFKIQPKSRGFLQGNEVKTLTLRINRDSECRKLEHFQVLSAPSKPEEERKSNFEEALKKSPHLDRNYFSCRFGFRREREKFPSRNMAIFRSLLV
ncbi:uncharacterized protein LOC111639040 [Centruroides sculpturatus]|uniref:uncharacterized protein LOC111639040 n=1 Tax=Centruroides sculpturatus TaxID=218467 RepID=UPI000C6CD2CD|nr:uncharacterized protein LOC111639040 [Centruroides sculpturatus]